MNYWISPFSLQKGTLSQGHACLVAMVPEEWIDSMPAISPQTQMMEGDIGLKAGKAWLKAVLLFRSKGFAEESKITPGGTVWDQEVSGKTFGQSVALHHQLGNAAMHRWVVLYQEIGTGITYCIGKPGSGMRLKVKYDSKDNTSSTLTFSRQSTERARVYHGAFTIDTGQHVGTATSVQVHFYQVPPGIPGATQFTIPGLLGNAVLWVSRNGMVDLAPIPTLPDTQSEIKYDPATGTFTVWDQNPLAEGERFLIVFKNL